MVDLDWVIINAHSENGSKERARCSVSIRCTARQWAGHDGSSAQAVMQDDRHRQLFFVAQMAGKEGLDRLGLVTGSTFIKLNQLDRSVGNPRVPIQHSVQRRVVLFQNLQSRVKARIGH